MWGRRVFLGLLLLVTVVMAARPAPGPQIDLAALDSSSAVEVGRVSQQVQDAGSAAVPALIAGLRHPSRRVRSVCLRHLEHLGDPTAAPAVAECLQDADVNVRILAARALDAGRGAQDKALLQALQHPGEDARVRVPLLEALGRHQPDVAAPRLETLLEDAKSELASRMSAARVLGRLRRAQSVPVLQTMALDHAVPDLLRKRCAFYLGWLGQEAFLRALLLKTEAGWGARSGAAGGLRFAAGGERAQTVEVLTRVAADAHDHTVVRVEACASLAALRAPVPPDGLAQGLASHDPAVRLKAAEAAMLANARGLDDILGEAIENEQDPCVRSALERALAH